mgnify:CR=1 FL=1
MKIYDRFIKENVAPEGAKKIGVWNGSSYGTIPLSGLTRPNLGSKLYSFAAVSDVHKSVANSNLDKIGAYDMTGDLDRALTFVKGKVNFVCGCGDLTLGGFETELSRLKTAINNKSFAVGRSSDSETAIVDNHFYSCSGNHEIYGRDWTTKGYNMGKWNLGIEPKALQEYWKTYMGMDKHTILTRGNDVFIFCSPDNATAYNSSVRNYSNADIEWLYNVLRTNRNKRCFVFTHFFFPAMSGDYGGKNTYYTAPMDSETERQMTLLLNKYRNVVWFSGHSHFVWESQGRADNKGYRNHDANIAKTADSGYCVHLPSLGQPRVPTEYTSGNSPTYYDEVYEGSDKKKWLLPLPTSQFAIVDVYSNYIVIKGLSYINGSYQYLPIAQYCLNTSLVNVDDAAIDFNGGAATTDAVYFYYKSNTIRTADGWLELNGSKVTAPKTGVQYTVRFMRYSNGESAEMLNGNATDYSFRLISSYNESNDTYVVIKNLDHASGRMLITFPSGSGLYRIKCLWHRDTDGAEISSVLIVTI